MSSLSAKDIVAIRIAGEVVNSSKPSETLKKWRELFNVSQAKLSRKIGVPPSVVSDYESGRRFPGTRFLKRFVDALIAIDEESGGHLLRELSRMSGLPSDVILDLKEFPVPVKIRKLCEVVKGEVVACGHLLDRNIYGYTILDSIKAIITLSDFTPIFGLTTERALIFTNVALGRSPMVAIRVAPLKPRAVVLHKPEKIDEIAIKLAEIEQIPLIKSGMTGVKELIDALREFCRTLT